MKRVVLLFAMSVFVCVEGVYAQKQDCTSWWSKSGGERHCLSNDATVHVETVASRPVEAPKIESIKPKVVVKEYVPPPDEPSEDTGRGPGDPPLDADQ